MQQLTPIMWLFGIAGTPVEKLPDELGTTPGKWLESGLPHSAHTPFHVSWNSSEVEKSIVRLLKRGRSIYETNSSGLSLMHTAVLNRSTDDVITLLKYKFDLNRSFNESETVLELAIKKTFDMVPLLLQLGAMVNMTFAPSGETYVHRAARKGDFLLMKGLIVLNADLDASDWKNDTALKMSARRNDPAMLNILAAGGADVSRGNLLHFAVKSNAIDCVRNLLARGLPVNAEDENGFTPMNLAFRAHNIEMADLLVKFKADLNKTMIGPTIHDLLAVKPDRDTVMWLLRKGLTLDKNVTNVIKAAIDRDDAPLLKILSDNGVDMNLTTSEGNLISYAASRGSVLSIKWLAQQGLHVNTTDSRGWTPLHYAIYNRLPTVKALVELGSCIDCKTMKGSTPLDFAKEFGIKEIIKYLEAKEEGENAQV